MSNVEQIMEDLEEKMRERDELILRLKQSLGIKEVWPEAFEQGTVKCHLEGKFHPRWALQDAIHAFGDLTLHIVRSDGESRTIPLLKAPAALRLRHVNDLVEIHKLNLTSVLRRLEDYDKESERRGRG